MLTILKSNGPQQQRESLA